MIGIAVRDSDRILRIYFPNRSNQCIVYRLLNRCQTEMADKIVVVFSCHFTYTLPAKSLRTTEKLSFLTFLVFCSNFTQNQTAQWSSVRIKDFERGIWPAVGHRIRYLRSCVFFENRPMMFMFFFKRTAGSECRFYVTILSGFTEFH